MGSASARHLALVADRSCRVADEIEAFARTSEWTVLRIATSQASTPQIQLEASGPPRVCGLPIDAIAFLASPSDDFAEGFAEPDKHFATLEAKAVWLGLTNDSDICAVNRMDPATWFGRSEWATWRSRFRQRFVPTANVVDGTDANDLWFPWSSLQRGLTPRPGRVGEAMGASYVRGPVQRSLWCFGELLAGEGVDTAEAAQDVMASHGCNLGEIVVDAAGRVVGATTRLGSLANACAPAVGEAILRGIS